MKLRARLAVTLLALGVPLVIGLAWLAQRSQRSAIVESTYEAAVQQMENGGRNACERRSERFDRPRRSGSRPDMRERWAYDESFHSSFRGQPPLDPELQSTLAGGALTATTWLERPARARIAMRMPFDGPCAVLVIERAAPGLGRHTWSMTLMWSSLVALMTGAIALVAMGPLVQRLRLLAGEVRAQKNLGFRGEVTARGQDEVAELAHAFNEAGAEIRRQVEEIRDRDQALTDYVANTTHDVMVPLTVLAGHLSRLRASIAQGQVDEALVSSAIDETQYLTSLLRNLGAAARLEAGEPHLHRHSLDLGELVERVVVRHRTIAREHEVTLDHAVPEEQTLVLADSTLAEQAIGNLVHNAVRYNKAGGHVAVVLERQGAQFELRVIDDGPGIADLARMGQSPPQHDPRERRATSVGLGLRIVRSVAERHDWKLRFDSPEEGGLVVALSGPIA